MEVFLAAMLKPLFLLLLLVPAVIVRVLIQKRMRDGKWKRLLLRR